MSKNNRKCHDQVDLFINEATISKERIGVSLSNVAVPKNDPVNCCTQLPSANFVVSINKIEYPKKCFYYSLNLKLVNNTNKKIYLPKDGVSFELLSNSGHKYPSCKTQVTSFKKRELAPGQDFSEDFDQHVQFITHHIDRVNVIVDYYYGEDCLKVKQHSKLEYVNKCGFLFSDVALCDDNPTVVTITKIQPSNFDPLVNPQLALIANSLPYNFSTNKKITIFLDDLSSLIFSLNAKCTVLREPCTDRPLIIVNTTTLIETNQKDIIITKIAKSIVYCKLDTNITAGNDINQTAGNNINETATNDINEIAGNNINETATNDINEIAGNNINETATNDINETAKNITQNAIANINQNAGITVAISSGGAVSLDSGTSINLTSGVDVNLNTGSINGTITNALTVAGPPIDNDQPILNFDATIGSLAFGIMPVGNISRVRAGVGSLTAGEVIQSINPPSIVCTDAAGESNLAQSKTSVITGANNLATTQCRTTSSKIKSLVPTFSDGAAALVHGMYGLATLRTQYVHSSGAKPNYFGGDQYVRVPLIGRANSGGLSTILGLIDNPAIKINFPIVDDVPVSANV